MSLIPESSRDDAALCARCRAISGVREGYEVLWGGKNGKAKEDRQNTYIEVHTTATARVFVRSTISERSCCVYSSDIISYTCVSVAR